MAGCRARGPDGRCAGVSRDGRVPLLARYVPRARHLGCALTEATICDSRSRDGSRIVGMYANVLYHVILLLI